MQIGVGVDAILHERAKDRDRRSTRVGDGCRRDAHRGVGPVAAPHDERGIPNQPTRARTEPNLVQVVDCGSVAPQIPRALIDTKDAAFVVTDADRYRQRVNRLAVERVDGGSGQVHCQACSDAV